MMTWSPTVRRRAVSGLVHLWCREEWRSSAHADHIRRVLVSMLADQDEVNRLKVASIVPLLFDDASVSQDRVKQRLLLERHPTVAAQLMSRLNHFVNTIPAEVDSTIAEVIKVDLWKAALRATGRNGDDECIRVIPGLLLNLALRWQTPTAVRIVEGWFQNPTASEVSRRSLVAMRPWLQLGDDRVRERSSAFALLRNAASVLEVQRTTEGYSETEVGYIHQSADAIVDCIYFASGAFTGDGKPPRQPDPGFAEDAFTALSILTGFKHPSTVHYAVQTLAHLAPLDPVSAFLLIETFVKQGDAYTFDQLASDTVIDLVERYLAEFREQVISSPNLITAIHSVLDAFVRVGWPRGVALSYRLGDAFR